MTMTKWLIVISIFFVITTNVAAKNTNKVTIYSYRQPFLMKPILDDFTKKTGIPVKVIFAKKGLTERIAREGKLSPADLVLTSDFVRLTKLVNKNLVRKVNSKILDTNIPPQFRAPDKDWYALTMRVRNLYSSKPRIGKLAIDYEDLAKPEFKGKICTRSGKHPYNVALVASMIAHHGERKTQKWLMGLKKNLARRPQGNDRAQVKAVKEGLCDLAIGNSYYLGKMIHDPKQKVWADAVEINFPNQGNRGSHINISGMALAKYAPNPKAAIKLMEYLSSDKAQHLYAEMNYEYPVNPRVAASELVSSWGSFKPDKLAIQSLADNHLAAVKLLDKVKFDL